MVDRMLTIPDSFNPHLVQVEGNLFKDRFMSMQQRELVDPRVSVLCVFLNGHMSAILTLSDMLTTVQTQES